MRLGLTMVLVVTAPVLPWWFVMLVGVVGVFVFPYYAEYIALAFWLDVSHGVSFFSVPVPWLSVFALAMVAGSMIARRYLSFYE